MSWYQNVTRIVSIGFISVVLCSNVAQAQEPSPAAVAIPITRGVGESIADFLTRVSTSAPQSVAGSVADILRNSPGDLADVIRFGVNAGADNGTAADIIRGVILAASADPVAITQQTSAFALANQANVAQVITLARKANTNPLSEVLGEGLALAASTLRSENSSTGNANAIAIQTQATAQAAPLALSEAFMDNFVATAAGAPGAAAAGPGGGGNVSNNAGNFNAGTGNVGAGGGVTQDGGGRASFGSGGGFSFARTTPTTINNFTTLPVPGPEAGVGVATLAASYLVYVLRRRRASRK